MISLRENMKVLVAGLGYRTGLAACNFLAARKCRVTGSDMKGADELQPVLERMDPSVRVVAGHQDPSLLDESFDLIVLSPGVPQSIPLIAAARKRGIPVISEIELAYGFMKGQIIAITGTDGKSTTTMLTGHILRELGINSLVGGNIGIPLISLVDRMEEETVSVIELSSFQLETIESFRPDAAAMLNVTPDHLDRYAGMEDYFRAKMRITQNQAEGDAFVYYKDDAVIKSGLDGVRARKLSFSLEDAGADAFLRSGIICLRDGADLREFLAMSRLSILGAHNALNVMASVLMVRSVLEKRGAVLDYEKAAEACRSFTGLPHRMETIGDYQGRVFINDSKATTVGAVEMALKSLGSNTVLILGGRTKGDDYSRLAAVLEGRIKGLVLIGESRESFSRIFTASHPVEASSLEEALVQAMRMTGAGDTVILSPACASFDMFANYEERGNRFKDAFKKLKRGELSWT